MAQDLAQCRGCPYSDLTYNGLSSCSFEVARTWVPSPSLLRMTAATLRSFDVSLQYSELVVEEAVVVGLSPLCQRLCRPLSVELSLDLLAELPPWISLDSELSAASWPLLSAYQVYLVAKIICLVHSGKRMTSLSQRLPVLEWMFEPVSW